MDAVELVLESSSIGGASDEVVSDLSSASESVPLSPDESDPIREGWSGLVGWYVGASLSVAKKRLTTLGCKGWSEEEKMEDKRLSTLLS